MGEAVTERVRALKGSATEELHSLVAKMTEDGVTDILSVGIGEPCFDTPNNIKKAGCDAIRAGRTKYEPAVGDYKLREAVQKKLHRQNNVDATIEQIMITSSGKFAVYLGLQATLGHNDQAIVLDPAWVTYDPVARLAGAGVVRVASSEMDGFQPSLKAIEKAMSASVKAIVITSPCNPTGAVFDAATVRGICKLAKARGAIVLSDEAYEDLIYKGEHYSPAAEFDNVISAYSFSKGYAMTGWRLGYVVASGELIAGMLKIQQHSAGCVPGFVQVAGIEALNGEVSAQARKKMVEAYRERRALVMKLIRESDFFDCRVEPAGAFYCFPSYRSSKPSVELAKELLEEVHVSVIPGSAFGECGEGHVRFCYACEPSVLVEAFDRIKQYVKRYQLSRAR